MKLAIKACDTPARAANETILRAGIGIGLIALVLGTQSVLVLLFG